jgi:hypothetical protein
MRACVHHKVQRRLDARRKSSTMPVQETQCLAHLAGQAELGRTVRSESAPVCLVF